jgi:hypothetical protein
VVIIMILLSSLVGVTTWALTSSAFIVLPVPEVSSAIEAAPVPQDLQIEAFDARSQLIELECGDCPFPELDADGELHWADGVSTTLTLNFSTNHGDLYVNDQPIFPPPTPPTTWNINAVERRQSDGKETEPIVLGFALEVSPFVAPRGFSEWLIRFTVLDLAGHPVPVDTIAVSLVKTDEQELFIVRTEVEPSSADPLSWRQCGGNPSCLRKLLIARIQALMAAAKERMMQMGARIPFVKGCMGPKHGGRPAVAQDGDSSPDGELPPHRHHHWGGGHRGHRMHRHGWQRTFSRVVRFIFIPAVLGVLAGLAASAIGMLVGQVVVFLWIRYRRHRGQSPATTEPASDMEKEALIAEPSDTEDLPPYSDKDHGAIRLPADKK